MKLSSSIVIFKGKSHTKIINELNRNRIEITRVKLVGLTMRAVVKQKDIANCKRIATVFNSEFNIVSNTGLSGGIDKIKLHAGLILGLIIAILIFSILSQYLLKIDIKCDNDIYIGEIAELLKRSGIDFGKSKSSINNEEIEQLIVSNISEVTFATANISGVCLKINVITEEIPKEPIFSEKVESKYDGIVTRVLVQSGTALVKAGDRVLKGQSLIGGYVVIDNDKYDDVLDGEHVAVSARGEVYGKIYFTKRLIVPEIAYTTLRTGKTSFERLIAIGRNEFKTEKGCEFSRFEKVVTYEVINVLVPLKVKTITYYELEEVVIEKELYKAEMLSRAREELINMSPAHAMVLNNWIIEKNDCNIEIIDVYLEVETRMD